ncbi:MAG: hypothetical protein ACREQQ_11990 [Candidatus Binatia bacterium]
MDPTSPRALRIVGVFAAAWAVLYVRFLSGLIPETEVDRFVHWAMAAFALIFGAGSAALEANNSGTVPRRDVLFGLAGALATFAASRFAGLV